MLFIGLLIFALFLYIRGLKISALIFFFFFLTQGFNLIPDELVDLGTPLTKTSDYAFFILLGFLTISFIFNNKQFCVMDRCAKYLIIFFGFLLICVMYNRFGLGIGFGEIIRTVRFLFFWLAYFVFRLMDREQLCNLLKYLYIITVFDSVLYLCQIIIGDNILMETNVTEVNVFGVVFKRFYNQPAMLHFMVFLSIYNNPIKGKFRTLSTIVLILAFFGAFHRSHIGFFIITVALGIVMKLPKIRQIQLVSVLAIVGLFVIIFFGNRFVHSRTFIDLSTVAKGNVVDADIDMTELQNATFTFRIAHLLERNEYIRDNPKAMLFGAGLLTEDSRMVDKMFDFKVGIVEEITYETIQLDTSDISYSFLLIRFGYLGTFLFLALYVYIAWYFYKHRDDKYGFSSFLYLIMTFGISFFSSNLIIPVTFILPVISFVIIQKTKEENE